MRGNSLCEKPRLHAPDPTYYDKNGSLPFDATLRTAGCESVVRAQFVVENPGEVTCHRCNRYLGRHAQFYNLLHNRWRTAMERMSAIRLG